MKAIRKILFVCSGNQCRSPVAEAVMRRFAREVGMAVEVSSAGTLQCHGVPAQPDTITAAAAEGFDLNTHRSRYVTAAIIANVDLILAMGRNHVEELTKRFPEARGRIRLFKPYCQDREDVDVGPDDDIPDPVTKPLAVHAACVREIEYLIKQLLNRWRPAHPAPPQ